MTRIFIAAWNAQGYNISGPSTSGSTNTWDVLLREYLGKVIVAGGVDYYYSGMVEAGHVGTLPQYYSATGDMQCTIGANSISGTYFWKGWDRAADKANPRCSMKIASVGRDGRYGFRQTINNTTTWTPWAPAGNLADDLCRPIFQAAVMNNQFYIYLMHVNGLGGTSHKQKIESTCALHETRFGDKPAIILGDANIDLQKVAYTPPTGWQLVRSGNATHKKGGELDWGLAYNCKTANVTQIGPVTSPAMPLSPGLGLADAYSDHAVMGFTVDL